MKTKKPKTRVENQDARTDPHLEGNAIKSPEEWKTGNEPLTAAQNSYLHTLASEAHENIEEGLSKAEASKKIDELQHKTGRGIITH